MGFQSLVEFQLNNMLTSSILSFFVLLFCSVAFGFRRPSDCQLFDAARAGNFRKVEKLLQAPNANPNAYPDRSCSAYYNMTPLEGAASKGHKEVVALLLDKNANIDQQSRYGNTALMAAASGRKKEVVELLLRRGADTTLKTIYGYNACDYNRSGAIIRC